MAFWHTTTSGGSGGDTLPIADTTGVVKGSGDATKIVRIEADGLSGSTTRILTMPDRNVNLGSLPDNYVNILDYANGDGTNEKVGINAWIAALTAGKKGYVPGGFTFMSDGALDTISTSGIVIEGDANIRFNESPVSSVYLGSTFVLDTTESSPVFFNFDSGASLNHQGPIITGLNFVSDDSDATAIQIKNMNHSKIQFCNFTGVTGGATASWHRGINLHTNTIVDAGGDAAWISILDCVFNNCNRAVSMPDLAGSSVGPTFYMERGAILVGANQTGVYLSDNTAHSTIAHVKMDGAGSTATGIECKGFWNNFIGVQFEGFGTCINITDVAGHANSGQSNAIAQAIFIDSDKAINFGSGTKHNSEVDSRYGAITTYITDTGAGNVKHSWRFKNYGENTELSGAGAVDLEYYLTDILNTGANTITIADGFHNQEIMLRYRTGSGTTTINANIPQSTITIDPGGSCVLVFSVDSGLWHPMGGIFGTT